ncbi:MAG TPA: dTMP kinase [Candidatus Dormibacteraeota bacterium]|nr:dTMP kinase [Candidatus Dormibacteraeota bacterium]
MGSARPGFFISVEGIDGSGKSTQARGLAERLEQLGERVTAARDPGSTALGERVRALLLTDSSGPPTAPLAEVALFLAARVQLLHEVIDPALSRGEVVVCDRFIDSTLAYQGFGRGVSQDTLLKLHQLVGADRLPDLTLVLDLAVSTAQGRTAPERPRDRMEAEPTAYHEQVRQGYLALAPAFPERVVVLPADLPLGQLAEACWGVVQGRLTARRAT